MQKALSIKSTVVIAAALLAGSVHAQTGTIVHSPGLACSTRSGSGAFNALSWSVGASSSASAVPSASGAEAKAARPQLSSFNLIKSFDECSSALFGILMTGSHVQTVTVTDRGAIGTEGPVSRTFTPVTIQLQDVQISQFMLTDATAAGASESISLVFSKITITNLNNGSKFCWDMAAGKTC